MHSVAIDRSGSPKKRTLSRGISEDESLRIIIQETESPSRRLTRSDSRSGTLKRKSESQQSEQDLSKALPDVMELQTSYEEVVQELHGLEVERETLLFQVDVLQDTLESVEELLAEAQREARQASMEVEQERVAKRKLEDTVRSLMSEVERLKEERNTISTRPAHSLLIEAETVTSTQAAAPNSTTHAWDRTDGASASPLPRGVTKSGECAAETDEGSSAEPKASHLQKMETQMITLALGDPCSPDGVLRRPCGQQLEDDQNNDTDSVSAYEDASAETPELDQVLEDEELDAEEKGERRDPNDPDKSCILS
ncbi:hypothetical protein NHX12_031149 [Muraenolepis orangiensis]|uniref:Uncharacterized protein n=1 Tax=Muraenolepis orangiensis TaxID=630683 RepID=A0A9Q0EFC3_9TELE|nr:hypothetical protein NHX12_031149 [Muraenolepis orangiensis]